MHTLWYLRLLSLPLLFITLPAAVSFNSSPAMAHFKGFSTADNAAIIQWFDNGNSNQQWQFVAV